MPQFVIVASLDHTDENLPVEERIALALKRCGVSVTCELELYIQIKHQSRLGTLIREILDEYY